MKIHEGSNNSFVQHDFQRRTFIFNPFSVQLFNNCSNIFLLAKLNVSLQKICRVLTVTTHNSRVLYLRILVQCNWYEEAREASIQKAPRAFLLCICSIFKQFGKHASLQTQTWQDCLVFYLIRFHLCNQQISIELHILLCIKQVFFQSFCQVQRKRKNKRLIVLDGNMA